MIQHRKKRHILASASLALIKFFFDMGVILFVALLVIFVYVYNTSIDADELTKRPVPQTSIIYDATGEHVLYKLHGEENRKIVGHDDISDYLRHATIAIEDERFYDHTGIDIIGILRAFRKNLEVQAMVQGGSTITQQVARNAFLSLDKTLARKFNEAVLAIKIERTYSKEQILDLYLNLVPYGSNTYGAEVAAQTYFGKNAKDLSLDEAAMIAAIPKATTAYSPYSGNKDALRARQQTILRKMGELGMHSGDKVRAALAQDTLKKVRPFTEEIDAPHFVFFVREELSKLYDDEMLEQGGFKVYTTLDFEMQERAEQMVSSYAERLPQYGASNASLVAINPKTGGVQAMVGSVNYFDQENDGNVNVSQELRQPGSSFKPIIYAAAFERGYQPETLLYDVKTSFGPDGRGKEYIPDNFDGRKYGLVSMRKAIQGSLNIPAVKAQYLVGTDNAIDFAEKLGISSFTDRNRFGLSLVLGGGEVKLVEAVGAYSVFANDGVRAPVHSITKIVDARGKETVMAPEPERVIDNQVARKVNSVLSDQEAREYVFGRVNVLSIPNRTVAAKTGTTQNFRDALTLGYTPSLAVGVWAGNNDGSFMAEGALGSKVAAPLWRQFIENEIAGMPDENFPDYEVIQSDLSMVTGKPGGSSGRIEYYYKKNGKTASARKYETLGPDKIGTRIVGGSARHSILHYVNRENPLDDSLPPERGTRMYGRWESSLRR